MAIPCKILPLLSEETPLCRTPKTFPFFQLNTGPPLFPYVAVISSWKYLRSSIETFEAGDIEDGCHSFTSTLSGHRHALVCKVCDQIVEYEDCPLEGIKEEVSRKTGFKIDNHYLQLFGTCSECQTSNSNA